MINLKNKLCATALAFGLMTGFLGNAKAHEVDAVAATAVPVTNAEYQTAFVKPLVRCASKAACRKIVIDKLTDLKTELVTNFIDYIWEWSAKPDNAQSDKELKEKLQELERSLRKSGRHNPKVQHKLDGLYELLSKTLGGDGDRYETILRAVGIT
ncbi:MAG: hypothetical protein L3J67_11890 [Hyphomicrobiaceae bacterium]|nr:hypothetical protein [Hyphomicrobiaceae bacterium]